MLNDLVGSSIYCLHTILAQRICSTFKIREIKCIILEHVATIYSNQMLEYPTYQMLFVIVRKRKYMCSLCYAYKNLLLDK
jgi:hypothetical protein